MSMKNIIVLFTIFILTIFGYIFVKVYTMESRVENARSEMEVIRQMLEVAIKKCNIKLHRFNEIKSIDPSCFENKFGFKKLPKDPWGNEYILKNEKMNLSIISLGADGAPGGRGLNKDLQVEIW